MMATLVGCDTALQDASPVVSPDNYPMVTFTPNFSGSSVKEGDTLIYTITLNKILDRSVTFTINQTGGTAVEDLDYIVEPGVMATYSLETELMIIFPLDDFPETEATSFTGEIEIPSLADKYLVNPNVEFPTFDLSLASVNDPTLLTIVLSWGTEDDIDIVTWSNTTEFPMTEWGDGGATGANPEIDNSIWLSDPIGTYYINFMHWGAPSFDYTLTLGHPDGTVEVLTGTFDSENLDNYTLDWWTAWGGDPGFDSYRVYSVDNDGTKFTVSPL